MTIYYKLAVTAVIRKLLAFSLHTHSRIFNTSVIRRSSLIADCRHQRLTERLSCAKRAFCSYVFIVVRDSYYQPFCEFFGVAKVNNEANIAATVLNS